MTVFDELLSIKRFRESQAELELVKRRQQHAAAVQAREEAERLLAAYRDEAVRVEDGMYRDLCSRLVRLREIEDVLQRVASLREGERRHEGEVDQAEQKLQQELQALSGARDHHALATRATRKFVEVVEIQAGERLLEMQYKEDMEMEEAASVARDRDDWEQHEELEG